MAFSVYLLLRSGAVCLLFCIFLWQTYSSVDKYFAGDTTTVSKTLSMDEIQFPGVSFCAYNNPIDPPVDKSDNLAELWNNLSTTNFILGYTHQDDFAMVNLTGEWLSTVTIDPWKGDLMSCFTYTARRNFSIGFPSTLYMFLASRTVYQSAVIVHPRKQNLVLPNLIHGRHFALVPRLQRGQEFKYLMFHISMRVVEVMPKDNLPCYNNDDYDFADCLERFIETEGNCILPWRNVGGDQTQTCTNATSYKYWNEKFRDASEEAIYKTTGCYFGCKYNSYFVGKVYDDVTDAVVDEEDNWPWDMSLQLFVDTGGIQFDREVLAFDFYDLVGNIGGFLGLFLGASILSMMDECKNLVDRFWGKMRKTK